MRMVVVVDKDFIFVWYATGGLLRIQRGLVMGMRVQRAMSDARMVIVRLADGETRFAFQGLYSYAMQNEGSPAGVTGITWEGSARSGVVEAIIACDNSTALARAITRYDK